MESSGKGGYVIVGSEKIPLNTWGILTVAPVQTFISWEALVLPVVQPQTSTSDEKGRS